MPDEPGAEGADGREPADDRAAWEGDRMRTTDPDLHDPDLLAEIELYGELVIAASASDGPLPASRIDEILGILTGDASE